MRGTFLYGHTVSRVVVIIVMLLCVPLQGKTQNVNPLDCKQRQFGMFIHWGIYSELGGVWKGEPVTKGYSEQIQSHGKIPKAEYQAVAKRFNPVKWNADEVVDLAVRAGMQYIVITAKHHDGFNMYHSKESDYNIVDATPFGRDILEELSEACRRKGVELGLYYSQIDWALPGAAPISGSNSDPIPHHHEEFSDKQLRELLTGYGEICELWFDMGKPTPAQSKRFRDTVQELQPGTQISGRLWNNQGDFVVTGDNNVPDYKLEGAWQVPATIRPHTWGYRSWQPLEPLNETIREKVGDLTRIIARGGNYLLNIGPKGDGSIVPFERDVLEGVGTWLSAHGDCVYDSEPNPFDYIPAFGDVAIKPGRLFLFVRKWPSSGILHLGGLASKVTQVTAVGADTPLAFTQDGATLKVRVPAEPWSAVLPVVEVAYEGDLDVRPTKVTRLAVDRPMPLSNELATEYYSMSGPYYAAYKRTVIRKEWLVRPDADDNYVLTMTCRLKKTRKHGPAHSKKTLELRVGGQSVTFEPDDAVRLENLALTGGELNRLEITLAEPAFRQEDLHVEIDELVLTPAAAANRAGPVLKAESDAAFAQRTGWFVDAKFGLFIHFGVYSTLEGIWQDKPAKGYAEWIQSKMAIKPVDYIPLAAGFHPDKLDADAWVKTARDAGMRYMVITAKHHEGFCLWDSAYTEYDVGEATPFDRDILGELSAACIKYGIKFGTYYSITDWHHPTQRSDHPGFQPPMRDKPAYVAYMKAQLKELIDRYDPAIIWFDADWVRWWSLEDGIDLYNYLRELNPELIINNRVAKRKVFKKDFGTPENMTPGAALDHLWEACWTINHSWGFKRHDTNWKSVEQLVGKQVDINTKGGNLLLNVGPKPDGSWPEACTERLLGMGIWNDAHRDAVYGARFLAAPTQGWGVLAQAKDATAEQGELFAYITKWPANSRLVLKGLMFGTVQATEYGGNELPTAMGQDGVTIDLTDLEKSPAVTVLRLRYRGGMRRRAEDGDGSHQSPNGVARVSLELAQGVPHWSVSYGGRSVLAASPLGITLERDPYAGRFRSVSRKESSFDETWSPVWGKTSEVRNRYTEVVWTLQEQGPGARTLQVVVRLYDDGVALRYRIPGSGKVAFSDDGTHFVFAGDPVCWGANGERPNIGPVKLSAFKGRQLPITFQLADDCYAALLEGAIYEFGALSPKRAGPTALRTSFERSTVALPAETSWRVLLLGKQPGDLLTANVLVNVNPPCKIEDVSWIKPGLAFWDWRAWGATAPDGFKYNLDMASWRRFIDFASSNGVCYLVLDANWYGHEFDPKSNPVISRDYLVYQPSPGSAKLADKPAPDPWDDPIDVPALIRYGNERNVGIFLYINDVARKHYDFEKTLAMYRDWGAAGIKYGFMKGGGQRKVRDTRMIVELCARYKLLCDFHDGPVPPSGDRRTWPNYVTREFCHAQCDATRSFSPRHFCTTVFCNMLAGPLDMNNGYFTLTGLAEARPRVFRPVHSTVAGEAARVLITFSGLGILPDTPESYGGKQDLFAFVRALPMTWDETRILNAEIGSHITTARRRSDAWYIASACNEEGAILPVDLDFLAPDTVYKATLFEDADDAHFQRNPEAYRIREREVRKGERLTVRLAPGGGHCLLLAPVRKASAKVGSGPKTP